MARSSADSTLYLTDYQVTDNTMYHLALFQAGFPAVEGACFLNIGELPDSYRFLQKEERFCKDLQSKNLKIAQNSGVDLRGVHQGRNRKIFLTGQSHFS